ncbi:hypothetical protein MN1_750 [Thermus phage MN1]|nr:hypothetical protein MN1_750 [Thermus phage MN1]
MNRKELIRLLLEAVQGVRGYSLMAQGDLVLAPSKKNPAVRRWQKVEWGWNKDREEDVRSGFIPELGNTLNVAHLLHKLHKAGHINEKALEAVMPHFAHRFENLPEEKKKKLREDPRYKELFQYYDAYREKRTPKLLKAVDKLVHGKKPWEGSKGNRGFSLSDGTTEPLVDWRGTMERKEAIRLLLEAVREVRGYALAEKEGLVLAPSKVNPAVRRWQKADAAEGQGGGLKNLLKRGAKAGLGVAGIVALLHLAGKAGTKAALASAMKAIEELPEEEREKLRQDPRFGELFKFYDDASKHDPRKEALGKMLSQLKGHMEREAEEHWKAFQKNRGFASGDEAEERLLRAMERYRGYALGKAGEK